MARNEAYDDAFTFSIDAFDALSDEEKIRAVAKNPEIMLRVIKKYKGQDSLDKNSLMYKLKLTAVSQPRFGFLLKNFESQGLSFDKRIFRRAVATYPNLIREMDKKYLDKTAIHIAIKVRPALIAYIPNEFMDGNMYQYCNTVLRLYVRRDEDRFVSLPETIKSTRYSACNAFTNSSPSKALSFTEEQMNLNGGKIMYKIVRKEPNIILCMMPEILRKNLILTAVSRDPSLYEDLPNVYRDDKTVKYRTYKALRLNGEYDTINEYFTEEENKKNASKFKAWETKKAIRTRYNLPDTENVEVIEATAKEVAGENPVDLADNADINDAQ